MAKRGHLWAFVVGMLLCGGDALLLVTFNVLFAPEGDWMSVGALAGT